jgi:uncharacterized protein YodC (DUF2158 family)
VIDYQRRWNVAKKYDGSGSSGKAYFEKGEPYEGLVVWCTWFDGNDEKQESFPADALVAYSD